jgi:opacity protein-like surface antigen
MIMRVLHRVVLTLGSLGLIAGFAQPARAADAGDITAGYSYLYDNAGSTGFPAGWFLSAAAINDVFAFVGDVSGHYKSQSFSFNGVTETLSINIYTFMAGPRVIGHSGPLGFYGQFLVGAQRLSGTTSESGPGIGTISPPVGGSASDTEFCYAPGAGVDVGLGDNAAVRVGVSERFIHFDSTTQKEFQLQLGFVYRFGAGR